MQFIDLMSQQALIRDDLNRNIQAVLDHGQYIMGPEVTAMERVLAAYVGSAHCVAVSSGTDALLLALMALDVGRGDEVITTPFSFIATAEVIALLGAVPVFVDIDARSYNLDPAGLQDAITSKTRAIMPVSLYGQCADLDEINAIAQRHGLPVIEDAAQSFGATYKGKRSCGLSTIGCTSFFPSKPLGCYGDGGACFTDDDKLAGRIRELLNHGQDRRYHHLRLGLNGRLDSLQAAVILAKMQIFPGEVAARARIGARYSDLLANASCVIPEIAPHKSSVFAQYTLLVDDRDRTIAALKQRGIPTAVHYPMTLDRQPALAESARVCGALPTAWGVAERVVSLPMHPYLNVDQQDAIVRAVLTAVS